MDPSVKHKSRLDKNLIVTILERIGHEEVLAPRQRTDKVLPRIPKEKSYLTKRGVGKKICSDFGKLGPFVDDKRDRFHTYRSRLDAHKPERLFVDDEPHLPGIIYDLGIFIHCFFGGLQESR